MEVRVVQGSITEIPSDALIVNLFEGVTAPGGATGAVDRALDGAISELIAAGEIKGKICETTLIHTHGKIAPKRVLVVGLGKTDEFDLYAVRKAAGAAIRFLKGKSLRSVTTIVHGAGIGGLNPAEAARATIEATILGMYEPDLYKKEKSQRIETFTLVERDPQKASEFEAAAAEGQILAEATNYARDLANEPANKMTPTILAEKAQEIAQEYGLEIDILDENRMNNLGMGAILAVAQGSAQPPRLIVMRYQAGDDKPTIAFIGKGLTFDSGGISIKPSENMRDMKFDMAGGAAVLGAMKAIAQLKPAINVLGVVPASENLPDGKAYKPGDVITCMSGKTVEIITTDAEGRMLLADAITYAKQLGADYLVDIATLTGSCVIALGIEITGLFGNNRKLIEYVLDASKSAGEKMWELPLEKDYMRQLKSDIADIENAGGRFGGAITGALFLKEFAEDTPWVHLDIAGTSDVPGAEAESYRAPGATGVGVRTFYHLVKKIAG
ncbi:MAG: leucyl aminopeptidase [Armatimonadota bacterium]|nr:leucyl aminopeptidase [Armatimonadota bacterium]